MRRDAEGLPQVFHLDCDRVIWGHRRSRRVGESAALSCLVPLRSEPTIYVPHLQGRDRLRALLRSLSGQRHPAAVVVVDNGSTDGSRELVREEFAEVSVFEAGENLGFGPALNIAIAERGGDPILILNDDVVCEPGFVEAMLEPFSGGAEMVAGVLLSERDPRLIDSAGVIADRTLMGFDYLHGEPREAAGSAPDPLGPTGGAALYSRSAFEAVGGFDERIFLYYEDLDLALRLRAAGARCRLAAGAGAVHAYSQTLGAAGGRKYARTGWSRGYMLRRYGVMRRPRAALRVLAAEGAICAGQMLADRTAKGLGGRLRGWRDARGLPPREAPGRASATSGCARPCACAEPGAGRSDVPRLGQPAPLAPQLGKPAERFQLALRSGREPAPGDAPGQGAGLDRRDPGDRPGGHELDLGGQPVARHEAGVLGARVGEPRLPDRVADVPDQRLGDDLEAPPGDPGADVEVDVLAERDVALVVAAQLREELPPQQARRAADPERLAALHVLGAPDRAGALLEAPSVPGERLPGAVDTGRGAAVRVPVLELEDERLDATEARVGIERVEQRRHGSRLHHRVGVEDEDRVRLGPPRAEVDGRGEARVLGQGDVGHAPLLEVSDGAVPRPVVDDEQLELGPGRALFER